MNGEPSFLDTNVLVYTVSGDELKAAVASGLLDDEHIISVQVLNEFVNVCRRKLKLDWPRIESALASFRTLCKVVPLTEAIHAAGIEIAKRHGLRIYDAMIVAAAQDAGCATLFSEDMQHERRIGGMTIRNPFR